YYLYKGGEIQEFVTIKFSPALANSCQHTIGVSRAAAAPACARCRPERRTSGLAPYASWSFRPSRPGSSEGLDCDSRWTIRQDTAGGIACGIQDRLRVPEASAAPALYLMVSLPFLFHDSSPAQAFAQYQYNRC